jgi:OPA family glycerol-3-phosphate transporter-like MFS transporter
MPRSKRRWQAITLLSLVVGYAGYYVCRSNLSVATPLLLDAFGEEGIDKAWIGFISSVGVAFYAVGKVFNGTMADFVGGRRVFLFGMVGSIAATIAFGLGTGAAVFVIAWSANRLIQSMGWPGLVKVASRWFSHQSYGRVMGFLSLSFLFGDAAARLLLGEVIEYGFGWQDVFFFSAAVLGIIALVNAVTLKSSPQALGFEATEVNPNNLFGPEGEAARPEGVRDLLGPLLRSGSFWVVMFLSAGMTLIRQSFTFWTPTFLVEVAGMSASSAAQYSLVYPLLGGVSVLFVGHVSDRWTAGRRGLVMTVVLAPLVPTLLLMSTLETTGALVPLLLVSASAFMLIGPYSFLSGAMALDLGGKKGSSTAAGLIDGAGYTGAILSGWAVGWIAQHFGWSWVFIALAVVAALTLIAAVVYWRYHEEVLPEGMATGAAKGAA